MPEVGRGNRGRGAVVVMAKAPRPGLVKTRLAQDLGGEAAMELYRCFVADTAALVSHVEGVQPYLAFTPEEAQAEMQALLARGAAGELASSLWRFFPQRGADLGERMAAAVEEVRARGHHSVVLVGSDSPHLPPARIGQAWETLRAVDLVLGPARDGGFYLLGTRRPLGDLLWGMTWGTAEVLAQTCQRAREAGWSLALLAEGYDVDTLADLQCLYEDLATWDGGPGNRPCPRTWDWLQGWRSCREQG